MSNYDYLSKLEVGAETLADYRITEVVVNGVSPVLKVRPANPSINKPYKNAMFKRMTKADKIAVNRSKGGDASAIMATRKHDRDLYPEYVIVGWEDLKDNDGNDVPYSMEECKAFISKLPDWIFDNLRVFCIQTEGFGSDVHITEAEEKAKKSRTSSPGS